MRFSLITACLVLFASSAGAAPITFTFDVSGQATLYTTDASGATPPLAFNSTVAMTVDPYGQMDVWTADGEPYMLVWQFTMLSHTEFDLSTGAGLPTIPDATTSNPLKDGSLVRINLGPDGSSNLWMNSTTRRVQLTPDDPTGFASLSMSHVGIVPGDTPTTPLGADWMAALFAAGPLSFSYNLNEKVHGEYVAGAGQYVGTARLISVPEPATGALMLIGLGVVWRRMKLRQPLR